MLERDELIDGAGMIDDHGGRAWFAPKALGFGWRPITWQGWVATFIFVIIILLTATLADPSVVRPGSLGIFLKTKTMLGLGETHLSGLAVAALVVLEIAAFLIFARWKSLALKPLD